MDNQRQEKSEHEQSGATPFVPPRHWVGTEELDPAYWADSKVQEKRGQEFFEKPVEFLENMDKSPQGGFARREFLTIMGASMAMASFACARRPVHKIIPYVNKPEEITPGVATWYSSTCQECSSNCGVLVKNREGRPIKLEGNPDHPLNQGTLCGRGQASILNLYDQDRLKAPKVRKSKEAALQDATWEQVDQEIHAKLKQISSQQGRVRILTDDIQSPSTRRLIQEFLGGFRQGQHVEYEPLHLEEVADAQSLCYGTEVLPRYRFDIAQSIVSFGADFLGTGHASVEYARAWSTRRKLEDQNPSQANLSKFYCFESMMTITGANADERYPVRPGDELKIALALANELILKQKRTRFAGDAKVQAVLAGYDAEIIAQEVGLSGGALLIQKIASELWSQKGRGLVVGGSLQTKTKNALALQVIVNFLNSALENEGSTVDGTAKVQVSRSKFSGVSKLIAEMKAGQVDALIISGVNPAYSLPRAALGLEDALKKVPLVISIGEKEDETARFADFVLPDHHYLENWGDANPRKGLYSLQQPAMAPIHSSRSFQEDLLGWAKSLNISESTLAKKSQDWHAYLQSYWKENLYKQSGAAGSFEQFWEGVLRSGVLDLASSAKPSARNFQIASLNEIPKYSASSSEEIYLALYSKVSMHDGRSANNAWLQEMPDPISSITWDNYLNVGPELAKKLGFKDDDVVQVWSGDTLAELPVHIQPGLHSSVVAAAVGYGRRSVGKVGNLAGVDVFPFLKVENGKLIFSGHAVKLKKTAKFYRLAATQWHTTTENRPIINDITLGEYRKNPGTVNHTDPHLKLETPSLWPEHEYKSYRWGMSIDLNSCIGCGSCVIACQAENNVPVVGREQVRVSRQMHWLKIDRYYSGSPSQPDVVFQPMLCQHCGNAPCETVCPVLATVHDDEGLNVQVYNRCVGTRYCQNNCPYKVRRFNFFDHWKSYEGTMNLAWNPDVTVRTRGIMEKCTFCVQRIRDAKDHAKDAGERVRDGDLKTACQQTCPTDAIVFGDINDPKSRVSELRGGPRAFQVLEVLNTKPSISYLTKVRNKEGHSHSAEEGKHE